MAMTAPVIRAATEQDIPVLYDLYKAIGKKAEGYFERCLAEQVAGKRNVLLAMTAPGQAAGYVMLNWQPQYALYRRLGMPEIQDLNVIPTARQQGIGSALIMACEDHARAKGCDHIGISVGLTADYGAAQRLYVKRGYMPDGYGVTYDRETVAFGTLRPVDDDLCLMMIRDLA